MDAFAMFKPFMIDNEYLYRSDNVRALHALIKDKEKHLLPWYPERLDWYDYWLNVHFPGMRKWVLPQLEEDLKIQERRSYTYKDLLDLFDTSTKRFPTRVAMRIERNGRKEQYTFEDVRELTHRAAGFFAANGIQQGDRVMLFANNMPEWGMTYFGILKAGATAIPIDPASTIDEILSFAKAGEASAIVLSPKLAAENPELAERLKGITPLLRQEGRKNTPPRQPKRLPPLLRQEGEDPEPKFKIQNPKYKPLDFR
jgi:long-chain acyl-CoA synthetase